MLRYFDTKYDSARDEIVAALADVNEGYGDEQFGDVDCPTGFVSTMQWDEDMSLANLLDAVEDSRNHWVLELALTYGVRDDDLCGAWIVQHDSQGFVTVSRTLNEDFDDFESAVAALRAQYEEWSDEEEVV